MSGSVLLIDSHCHLDLMSEPLEVIQAASAAGLHKIIVPAVSRQHWPTMLSLKHSDFLGMAFGLHPCFSHSADDVDAVAAHIAAYPKDAKAPLVALGECGLDGTTDAASMPQQVSLLERQLEMARAHDLPVILHAHKAHNELLTSLKRVGVVAGGVVHGFSGSVELAQQYLRHGLAIGVGGVITYERAQKTRQTMAALPVESLLLETDSPDMPLSGFQGQPNHPARLPLIAKALSQLRNQNESALTEQIGVNTYRVFPALKPVIQTYAH